jgi:CRISPR-associated protein Cas2
MSTFWVVCFDVKDAQRLRKVSDELENFGTRVQRSLFECRLEGDQVAELAVRLDQLIDAREDHVRYYPLCPKDEALIIVDGPGKICRDLDYFLL